MKGAVCREHEFPWTLEASTVLWPLGFTLMMISGITRVSLFLKGDVDFNGTIRAVDFVTEQTLALGGEPGLLDGRGFTSTFTCGGPAAPRRRYGGRSRRGPCRG